MTSTRPSHYRIWLLVSPRDAQSAHPKEIYHWNVVVENTKTGIWKECHASESHYCGKGGVSELFDPVPAVYGRPAIRDSKYCVEVASFDPSKMGEISKMLESVRVCDFKAGATCRKYAIKVLSNLKLHQDKYGVVSLTSFKDAWNELEGEIGPLEKAQKVPTDPSVKSQPDKEQTTHRKVTTSIGGKSRSDKEKTTTPKSTPKAKTLPKGDHEQNTSTRPNTRSSTRKKTGTPSSSGSSSASTRPAVNLDNIKTRVPDPRRASDGGHSTTRVMSFINSKFTQRRSAP